MRCGRRAAGPETLCATTLRQPSSATRRRRRQRGQVQSHGACALLRLVGAVDLGDSQGGQWRRILPPARIARAATLSPTPARAASRHPQPCSMPSRRPPALVSLAFATPNRRAAGPNPCDCAARSATAQEPTQNLPVQTSSRMAGKCAQIWSARRLAADAAYAPAPLVRTASGERVCRGGRHATVAVCQEAVCKKAASKVSAAPKAPLGSGVVAGEDH